MRGLRRNQRKLYYCLLDQQREYPVIDERGNESGENIQLYADPAEMWANVTPASGISQTEQFGGLDNYDKVVVTTWMDCPIDENTVLFIDKEPEFSEAVTLAVTESNALYGDDEIETIRYRVPKYDYVVRRVAKSLNSISIAVSKVKVS